MIFCCDVVCLFFFIRAVVWNLANRTRGLAQVQSDPGSHWVTPGAAWCWGWLIQILIKCAEPMWVEFLLACREKTLVLQPCSAASPSAARAALPRHCPSASRALCRLLLGWSRCDHILLAARDPACACTQSFGAVLVGHSPTQRWLSAVQKRSGWLPQRADKECASVKLRSGVNAGLRGGFLPSSVDFQACVWHGKFAYRDSHPIQVSTCILCPHSFSTLA